MFEHRQIIGELVNKLEELDENAIDLALKIKHLAQRGLTALIKGDVDEASLALALIKREVDCGDD